MREINVNEISRAVRKLYVECSYHLPPDIEQAISEAAAGEPWPVARDILAQLKENLAVARQGVYPICQDTGMCCVYLYIGQDVHLTGGDLSAAVDQGVREGQAEGYLRKSMLLDPIERVNSGDNTPALLSCFIVPGEQLRVVVAPKGGGSENMCRIAMLPPAAGIEGVHDFVLQTVQNAGANPCPPLVIGVGVGGNFDHAALLSKQALLRPLARRHPLPLYRELEQTLLDDVNKLGVGPQGFGGATTALAVNIEVLPTHIACLPVAVSIGCHVTRHAELII
ncbi:MAG: fumarate hydratase [Bacillota bacterium]|nr:fumarate hydratase [Bacillota bacterium]